MNISSIRQSLENIDYAWAKPQTYLVLIPGLSLVIQKIQLAKNTPLLNNNFIQQNAVQVDAESRKFINICKWHVIGSLVQIIALSIAVNVFAAPIFLLLAIPPIYESVDTLIKGLTSPLTFCEFNPNGDIKRISNKPLSYSIFF